MKKLILICLISMGLVSLPALTATARKGGQGNRQVKYEICHWSDEDNEYSIISVAEPAVAGHERHGDFVLPESGDCGGTAECFDIDTPGGDGYLSLCEASCGSESSLCIIAESRCSGEYDGFICGILVRDFPCLCSGN